MTSSPPRPDREPAPEGPLGILRRGPDGRPSKWWPAFLVGVGVVLVGAWWATNSPLFGAKSIDVNGASHLSSARVLRLAKVGMGTNLFWFDAGAVEARLEKNPWIEQADVSRSLPSTLRIDVVEQRPVVEVKSGDRWFLVGEDGTILTSIGHEAGLPRIGVNAAGGVVVPSSIPVGPAKVVGGMGKWLRSHVRTIARKEDGDVVLHLVSGIPVYYGDAFSVTSKNQVLAAVLKWARANDKQLLSINVKAPLAPTAQLYEPIQIVTAPSVPVLHPSGPDATDPAAAEAVDQKDAEATKKETEKAAKKTTDQAPA